MTKKLFSSILTTCLLFSSLYLPAYAESASKTPQAKTATQARKSPEGYFLEGNDCLKLGNVACAKLASANIPSTSPYAKLLQGSIALNEKQTDNALLLLLPLQTEDNLALQAKIALHEQLASAFESLDDPQQAMQHLIQADTLMATGSANPPVKDTQASNDRIHEKIWNLLKKQEQSELVELRGHNTDNVFQGWVDLRLASKNQDLSTSMASWSTLYPDHPAQAFAKKLSSENVRKPASQAKLSSKDSIALLAPLADGVDPTKVEAFKLGLESALLKSGLSNPVKRYTEPHDSLEAYTLALNEGSAYFIAPNFGSTAADNKFEHAGTGSILKIGLPLGDEIEQIISFALSHGMQRIAIITTDSKTSEPMLKGFMQAWQARFPSDTDSNSISVITLPAGIASAEGNLLELKSQIAARNHDMILLAMNAPEARLVRPYLDISIPTMAFSSINASAASTPAPALNAIRFAEMPFLIAGGKDEYTDYHAAAASLNSNELSRWFALGADSLQLLISHEQQDDEATISGLSGNITISSNGSLKHQLSLARFTYKGVEEEQ